MTTPSTNPYLYQTTPVIPRYNKDLDLKYLPPPNINGKSSSLLPADKDFDKFAAIVLATERGDVVKKKIQKSDKK